MRFSRGAAVLGLLCLSVACSQNKSSQSSQPVKARSGASGNATAGSADGQAGQAAKEEPLFVGSASDMTLECKPKSEMPFLLSQKLGPSNSYLLARFAMIGAENLPFKKESLEPWLSKFGLDSVTSLESNAHGVRGFVATSKKFNLVVFQGTHSAQGVVTDLRSVVTSASPDNLSGGVHKGFKSGFDQVKSKLTGVLTQEPFRSLPTFLVGHSLGGALAVLAALELDAAKVSVAGVVTLGQPRVGNEEFAAAFERGLGTKYKRFVFENDPIPHLPPSPANGERVTSLLLPNSGGLLSQVVESGAGLLFARAKFKHAAAPIPLGAPEYSNARFESDNGWDEDYWGRNTSAVTDLVSNPLAAPRSSLVADHGVDRYLCAMLDNIQ